MDRVWVQSLVTVNVRVNPNLGHLDGPGFTNPERRLGLVT